MSWIEDHPYKMALFASIFCSSFALLQHYRDYNPPQLGLFFLWLPTIWIFMFGIVGAFELKNKVFKDGS